MHAVVQTLYLYIYHSLFRQPQRRSEREMERLARSMATSPVNHRLLALAGNRRERRSSILARRLLIRGSSSALSRPTCLYKYLDVQQPPASVDFYCWMWMLGVAQSPSSLLATAPYAFVHNTKNSFFPVFMVENM